MNTSNRLTVSVESFPLLFFVWMSKWKIDSILNGHARATEFEWISIIRTSRKRISIDFCVFFFLRFFLAIIYSRMGWKTVRVTLLNIYCMCIERNNEHKRQKRHGNWMTFSFFLRFFFFFIYGRDDVRLGLPAATVDETMANELAADVQWTHLDHCYPDRLTSLFSREQSIFFWKRENVVVCSLAVAILVASISSKTEQKWCKWNRSTNELQASGRLLEAILSRIFLSFPCSLLCRQHCRFN